MEINFYSKDKDWGWMSNFYPSEIVIDEISYPTVEHYYQSKKASDIIVELWIRNAPTPYLAFKAGRSLKPTFFIGSTDCVKTDWDDIKVDVMKKALKAKFTQNPYLGKKLIDTGNAVLHEESPTDIFWGKKGKDMLGKLLMEIRNEI